MDSLQENAILSIISSAKILSKLIDVKNTRFDVPWAKVSQYADDCEDLDRVKASMQSAKAVEVTLRLVLASTSKVVARLQDRFKDLINQSRFMDLPDDILASIFSFACRWGRRATTTLTSVCRRFREIVVRLPTGIDFPRHSVRYASLLASRSAAPNMTFVISDVHDISERSDRFNSMLQLGASISARLRIMQLNLKYIEDSFVRQISHTFSAVSLPHLDELRITCAMGFGRKCTAICRDWDMPSLRKLEAINVIPELPSAAASNIRSCRIEIEEGNGKIVDWRWRAIEILDFFMELASLEYLDITFPLRQDDRPAWEETIILDTVTALVLRLPKVNSALHRNFLHIAEVPNITSLSLEIGLTDLKQFGKVLDNIGGAFRNSVPTSLTDLTITIVEGNIQSRTPFMKLPAWCLCFQNLKHITLNSPRRRAHGLFSFANNIDSVRMSNPNFLKTQVFLLNLLPNIWRNGPSRRAVWDGLEIQKEDPGFDELMDFMRIEKNDDNDENQNPTFPWA